MMNEKQKKDAESIFKEVQSQKLSKKDYEEAKRKAGNLGDQVNNFKLLLSMLKDSWNGDFLISTANYAILVGAIIYVISPFDAIPDVIPFFGWVDDIAIVTLAMSKLKTVIEDYSVFKEKK